MASNAAAARVRQAARRSSSKVSSAVGVMRAMGLPFDVTTTSLDVSSISHSSPSCSLNVRTDIIRTPHTSKGMIVYTL